MKLRALANGNEFESDDEAAQALIATGLYERADGKKLTKDSASAVRPLTTGDLPTKKGRKAK